MALTHLNVSIGTAAVLGLADVAMDVAPTTAYLMVGGRCSMACRFCAQARTSQAGALNLSRVTWPEFPEKETVSRLAGRVLRNQAANSRLLPLEPLQTGERSQATRVRRQTQTMPRNPAARRGLASR